MLDSERNQSTQNESYGHALREIGESTKDIVQSELSLVAEELKLVAKNLSRDINRIVTFGAIAALGVFPLVAFLVIGLGRLLSNNYWLSSLIVGLVFTVIGGSIAYGAFKKMKSTDISLHTTQRTLKNGKAVVEKEMDHVKHAVKGEMSYESHQLH